MDMILRTALAAAALAAGAPAADPAAPVTVTAWGTHHLLVTAPAGSSALPAGAGAVQMDLDAQETPLPEVADLIRRASGLNVVVASDVLAEPPLVTMQVRRMRLDALLRWIEATTGVAATWTGGALYLSRTPPATASETRLYDVSDLVTGLRDFPGPAVGLRTDGGGNGLIFTPPADAAPAPAMTIEDLAELIRRQAAAH
jgi:hypothetical protein